MVHATRIAIIARACFLGDGATVGRGHRGSQRQSAHVCSLGSAWGGYPPKDGAMGQHPTTCPSMSRIRQGPLGGDGTRLAPGRSERSERIGHHVRGFTYATPWRGRRTAMQRVAKAWRDWRPGGLASIHATKRQARSGWDVATSRKRARSDVMLCG